MLLQELYLQKKKNYMEKSEKNEYVNLLAILLLMNRDKFMPLPISSQKFYEFYRKEIQDYISFLEKDFNITDLDMMCYLLNKGIYVEDLEEDKIEYCYAEAVEVLHWAVMYVKNLTAEEIYTTYFESDSRKRKLIRI